MGISDFINLVFTQPIFNGLMLLYHLFGDFALSIIVLTVIIRLILFPLTLQQLKSTKAMQELQPQMAALRKKYKDDQRGQAAAMQALYKEYSVNPLAGCLPLLVQFPVLYGLYFAFRAVLDDAVAKGGSVAGLERINGFIYPFLPKFTTFPNLNLDWFTFINSSWHLSLAIPDPTHILPVLAGIATFVQLRMSQSRSNALATQTASNKDSNAKDPMAQQQQTMKMMSWMMPIVTIFIGWNFPAGLALYWTTGSVFMAIQQYFVTGWGSLLVAPNLTRKSDKDSISYKGDASKETRLLDQANATEYNGSTEALERGNGNRSYSNGNGNGSSASARRRTRSGSASARRRGGTVPKRNPTRG